MEIKNEKKKKKQENKAMNRVKRRQDVRYGVAIDQVLGSLL